VSERSPDIIVEDPTLAAGFTQIPNQILRRPDLSAGAKLTYMMLLSYAWQHDRCFPGQERLATDMGASERSIRTYLKELQECGLISVRRRGLNLTNLYVLHGPGPADISGPGRHPSPGPANLAAQDRQQSADQERQPLPPKKTQQKKTQKNNGALNAAIDETPATSPDPLDAIRAMSPEERLLLFEQRRDELSRMPRLERRGGR